MSADLEPGHGGNAGLCLDDHTCPGCESGGPCVDLFEHPICGTVACTFGERPLCPECTQGKTDNCVGVALDFAADEFVPCSTTKATT